MRAQLAHLARTGDLAAMARWGWAPALVRRVPMPAGGSRVVYALTDGTEVRVMHEPPAGPENNLRV